MALATQLRKTRLMASALGSGIIPDAQDSTREAVVLNNEFPNIAITLENSGKDLTDFALVGRATKEDTTYQTIISGATWGTVAGILKAKVGALNTLASGSKAMAILSDLNLYDIKFEATISGGTPAKGTFTASSNPTNDAAAQTFTISTNPTNAQATGTLTLTANPADTGTITIGSVTYTFNDTTLVDTPNNVLIGATASDTIDNLIAAITNDTGEGTVYGTGTVANPDVTAAAGAGDTMDATAIVPGTGGNSLATTNTATNMSWGAATLTGGTTETVTIGSTVYTFVDTLAAAYDVLIGATASDTCDNLIAAINGDAGEGSLYGTDTVAHPTVTAAAGAGDTVDVTAITPGTAGNSIATTETCAACAWGDVTLLGGTTETVTIDSTVYTFKATLVDAYDVLIGASASDTLDNLIAAINADTGEGTLYGTGTVIHPSVTAAAGAGDTMDVTANDDITAAAGTLIATTETCAACAWGATTLADEVATDLIVNVIGSK